MSECFFEEVGFARGVVVFDQLLEIGFIVILHDGRFDVLVEIDQEIWVQDFLGMSQA